MKGEGQWASSSAPAAAPTAKAQPEPMGATRWSGTGAIGIFDKLEVKPYGVLGLQFQGRGDDGETRKETTARANDLYAVVVDSTTKRVASVPPLMRPSQTHGATYEIYDWALRSGNWWRDRLPEEVTNSLMQGATQAKFHAYNHYYKVIHTIAPDFSPASYYRSRFSNMETGHGHHLDLELDPAVPLAATYRNVFREMVRAWAQNPTMNDRYATILRLPVLSDGSQAGLIPNQAAGYQFFNSQSFDKRHPELAAGYQVYGSDLFPALTAKAIERAFAMLAEIEQEAILREISIELCVYNQQDFEKYSTAIKNRREGVPQATPTSMYTWQWEPKKSKIK
eukprot:g3748.t1